MFEPTTKRRQDYSNREETGIGDGAFLILRLARPPTTSINGDCGRIGDFPVPMQEPLRWYGGFTTTWTGNTSEVSPQAYQTCKVKCIRIVIFYTWDMRRGKRTQTRCPNSTRVAQVLRKPVLLEVGNHECICGLTFHSCKRVERVLGLSSGIVVSNWLYRYSGADCASLRQCDWVPRDVGRHNALQTRVD